jgi:hypothetical protein
MSWNDDLIDDVRALIILHLDWASAHLFSLTAKGPKTAVDELKQRGLLAPTVQLHVPRAPLHPLSLMAYGHRHFGALDRYKWAREDGEDLLRFPGGHVYVRPMLIEMEKERELMKKRIEEDENYLPELYDPSWHSHAIFENFAALFDLPEWRRCFKGYTGLVDLIYFKNIDLLYAICMHPRRDFGQLRWIDVRGLDAVDISYVSTAIKQHGTPEMHSTFLRRLLYIPKRD